MKATALQQIASTFPLLLFGLLALAVWRRLAPGRDRAALAPGRDRATLAWGLTAANFLIVGTYATAHSIFAAVAIATGEGSWPWNVISHWAGAANAARAVVSMVYAGMLLGLMALDRRTGLRIMAVAWRVLLALAIVVTLVARALVPFDNPHTNYTVLAVLNGITAISLMAALVAAVLNDGMDELLWLAATVYALKEVVTVSLLGVMAWWAVSPQGAAMRIIYWMGIVLTTVMAALAARRLQLAARGRPVPGVFERLDSLRRPAPKERPL